ncbi:alpha/beta hydrolase [Paenibacillus sambharensis]|uniref:Alpha/beta hydrolase n=1 Tax=Paenibacillus sambharensis TaxID=1803190 RepID=A0A2W1L712_9BACL|nr:alpha/beta hydrolase [Paenibacillus sambharensis]PZD94743.1 alpha/beta hydrolase [Paenibacillus sambharensis]
METVSPVNTQTQAVADKKRRRVKKISLALAALIVILALVCSTISVYIGYQLTRPEKKPIAETPADYGMVYTDQIFTSKADDSAALPGWVIEPEEPVMTVIMSHGYRGNRLEKNVPFLPLAQQFIDANYRVIMYDFRHSGEAGGKMVTLGTKEKYDLLGVIDYAKSSYDEPVALYGISMGAATSILAAGLSADVMAVVADSPFSDLKSYLSQNMSVWTGLPHVPFTPLTMFLMPFVTEIEPEEASPIKAVEQIYPRPIYFIHGTGDTYIPYTESQKMAALHPDRFQIWNPEGIQHVKTYEHHADEYAANVIDFFEKSRAELSAAQ